MNDYGRLVTKARTIETLEIFDIMEIVVRDFERYNVPDAVINAFLAKYVIPMQKDSEKIKYKFTNNNADSNFNL